MLEIALEVADRFARRFRYDREECRQQAALRYLSHVEPALDDGKSRGEVCSFIQTAIWRELGEHRCRMLSPVHINQAKRRAYRPAKQYSGEVEDLAWLGFCGKAPKTDPWVRERFASLSEHHQAYLWMRFWMGWKTQDIATFFDKKPTTISQNIRNALNKMRG